MRHDGSHGRSPTARRTWKAPTVSAIALRTKTRSSSESAGTGKSPPAPSAPSTKLGFAFEMAFPLSSRMQ